MTPEVTLGPSKPQNVVEALAAVMRDLPGIGKASHASQQQGGYAYRGIDAITSATQPLLAQHGVVFVPHLVRVEIKDLVVNGKPWTDTHLDVTYTVYGPGGVDDCITVGPIRGIGRDNSDKGANKAMTQAMKYALLQTLCVSDRSDDSDGTAHQADSPARPARAPRSDAERPAGSEPGSSVEPEQAERRSIPAGWETAEEWDDAAETYTEALQALNDHQRANFKLAKDGAEIGWPPTPAQMTQLTTLLDAYQVVLADADSDPF